MVKVVFKLALALAIVLSLSTNSTAQVTLPPLERPITIDLNGESTDQALVKIKNEGDFSFVYRTDMVDHNNSMTRSYNDKTVREILDDLFQGTVVYKEKGNYIVLKSAPQLKQNEISLEGYVIDLKTGLKVPYTSIYDSITLASTVSDEYGHYQLKLSKEQEVRLTARKFGYEDTSFVWSGTGKKVVNIRMTPLAIDSTETSDTLNFFTRLRNLKLFKPSEEQKANIVNFKERFQKTAQFSLIPSVGTNGAMSPNMTVDYSFNLLGGFNGGVRVAEVGGLFNVVWDSVSYFQAAGLFNTVGGPQKGFQGAGFTNINGSSFTGFQGSGFFNFTKGEFKGAQIAGFANATGTRVNGFQGAGFWNQNIDSSKVVQVAGFGNLTGRNTTGAQLSGFINLAGKNYKGFQGAGFVNLANGGFKGTQVAGFLNIAKDMTGTQIGFINISDSLSGAPIGFFSYSRKGYHNLEISTNEVTPLNLAFKSGTNSFYNSFFIGVRPKGNETPYYAAGYGIGTSVRGGGKNRVFFDFQSMAINRGNDAFELALLNKFTTSYHVQLKPKLALAFGPSFNVYLVDNSSSAHGSDLLSLTPYSFYDVNFSNDMKLRTWVGGHIALRLF